MTCAKCISYFENTSKKIYLSNHLFTEFESKLFPKIFRQYKEKTIENINLTVLMNYCQANVDKAVYERNIKRRVYLYSERIILDCRDDKNYCPEIKLRE